jgi:hypothetical protein
MTAVVGIAYLSLYGVKDDVTKGPLTPNIRELSDVLKRRAALGEDRYQSIKVSPEVAQDEIRFWSRQLSEHALFLHLGLEEPRLKKQGLALHKENPEIAPDVLPLTKKLRAYKMNVLKTLNSGKWIGWIFPLFARHILVELDYFVDKLNGIPYSDRDEVIFWNMINGEHAGFASHLLDPSERELFTKADELFQKFEHIVKSEKDMMLQISLRAAKQLNAYNKKAQQASEKNQVRSVIHPVLIAHVIREGQRSIKILNSLQDTEGAIYPEETGMEVEEIAVF